MTYRSVLLGVLVAFVVPACGGGSSTPIAAGETSTIALATTTSSVPVTTAAPSTTALRATTTRPPSTTTRASPTTLATSPTTTSTVPAARTVSRGATFSVRVGETVTLLGEGLSVTYVSVGADGRCRPGQQCLVAGDATVSVGVRKDPMSAVTLSLHTDSPASAQYGTYTVELVLLGFGSPPVASLRVT